MSPAGRSSALRRKLIGLLAAFGIFAVASAATIIYAIEWQVKGALHEFEHSLGQAVQIDHVHVALRRQMVSLGEIVEGRTDSVDLYFASREEFFSRLRQIAAFVPSKEPPMNWANILHAAEAFADESNQCLELARSGRAEEASGLLKSELENKLYPALNVYLTSAKAVLDESRSRATLGLTATSSRVLLLTIAVGVLAAGLVIIGVTLIRRWIMLPIVGLQDAAQRFSEGDLTYRVEPHSKDELGTLGLALNEMARSLADAQAKLKASETKHRLLFQNLRDAVVICDENCVVLEYHDGDTHLLGVTGSEHVGRHLLDVWSDWKSAQVRWSTVIRAAALDGRRFRAVDVGLKTGESGVCVDLLVYRIKYGDSRYAAVVVRDVTERQHLQRKLRQAETMEAVGTLAGGLAHDFNNLLAGAIGSLSLLASEITDSEQAERIRTVLRTCWQAVGLSKRLLNFAGSAHGEPQVFAVQDAVSVITNSLDPSFIEGVEIQQTVSCPVSVRMDRDQFTQLVLNLLRNARDAMPEGGSLFVEVGRTITTDPDEGSVERPYAFVMVRDTGLGMSPEVQSRIFEPFFTTKSRATRRGRGMGMAITHSAVRNAGGFLRIESEQGCGTTIRVFIPEFEDSAESSEAASRTEPPSRREHPVILFVDEDPVMLDVGVSALNKWGYAVLSADGIQEARARISSAGAGGLALAVIDMSLSDGDGLELAEQVVLMNPDASLVLTAPVAETPLPSNLKSYVRAQLVKPFHLDALAAAVSESLSPSAFRN